MDLLADFFGAGRGDAPVSNGQQDVQNVNSRTRNTQRLEAFFSFGDIASSFIPSELDHHLFMHLEDRWSESMVKMMEEMELSSGSVVVIRLEMDSPTRGIRDYDPRVGSFIERGASLAAVYGRVRVYRNADESPVFDHVIPFRSKKMPKSRSKKKEGEEEKTPREYTYIQAYDAAEQLDILLKHFLDWFPGRKVMYLAGDTGGLKSVIALSVILRSRHPGFFVFVRRCLQHQLAICGTQMGECLSEGLSLDFLAVTKSLFLQIKTIRISQEKVLHAAHSDFHARVHAGDDYPEDSFFFNDVLKELGESSMLEYDLNFESNTTNSGHNVLKCNMIRSSIIDGEKRKGEVVGDMLRYYKGCREPKWSRWLSVAPACSKRLLCQLMGNDLKFSSYIGGKDGTVSFEEINDVDDRYYFWLLAVYKFLQPCSRIGKKVLMWDKVVRKFRSRVEIENAWGGFVERLMDTSGQSQKKFRVDSVKQHGRSESYSARPVVASPLRSTVDFLSSMEESFYKDCEDAFSELVGSKKLYSHVIQRRIPAAEWLYLVSEAEKAIACLRSEVCRRYFRKQVERDVNARWILDYNNSSRDVQEAMVNDICNGDAQPQFRSHLKESGAKDIESWATVLGSFPASERSTTMRAVAQVIALEDPSSAHVERKIQLVKRAQTKNAWKNMETIDIVSNRVMLLSNWMCSDIEQEETVARREEATKKRQRKVRPVDVTWGRGGEIVSWKDEQVAKERNNQRMLDSLVVPIVVVEKDPPVTIKSAAELAAESAVSMYANIKSLSIESYEKAVGQWHVEKQIIKTRQKISPDPPLIGHMELYSRVATSLEKLVVKLGSQEIAIRVGGRDFYVLVVSGDYYFIAVEIKEGFLQWCEEAYYSENAIFASGEAVEVHNVETRNGKFVVGDVAVACSSEPANTDKKPKEGEDGVEQLRLMLLTETKEAKPKSGTSNVIKMERRVRKTFNDKVKTKKTKNGKEKRNSTLDSNNQERPAGFLAGASGVGASAASTHDGATEMDVRLASVSVPRDIEFRLVSHDSPESSRHEDTTRSSPSSVQGMGNGDMHSTAPSVPVLGGSGLLDPVVGLVRAVSERPICHDSRLPEMVGAVSNSRSVSSSSSSSRPNPVLVLMDRVQKWKDREVSDAEMKKEAVEAQAGRRDVCVDATDPAIKYANKGPRAKNKPKSEQERKEFFLVQDEAESVDLSEYGLGNGRWSLTADAINRYCILPIDASLQKSISHVLRVPEFRGIFGTIGVSGRRSLTVRQNKLVLVKYALWSEYLLFGNEKMRERALDLAAELRSPVTVPEEETRLEILAMARSVK